MISAAWGTSCLSMLAEWAVCSREVLALRCPPMFSTSSSNACCEYKWVPINSMCSKKSAVHAVGRVGFCTGPRVGPATNRCCLDIYFTDLPSWTSTTNLMQGRAEETTVRYIWTNIVYIYMNAPNNKRPPKKPKKPNYLIRTYDESYTTQHSLPPIGPQQVMIQCFRCPAAAPLFATSVPLAPSACPTLIAEIVASK